MSDTRVLVFGAGASGRAAAALLRDEGAAVTVLDGAESFPADGAAYAYAVTSPGIPLAHPWQVAARAAGLGIVSELQLGVERLRARGVPCFAVTGSKGKSSVVKLVAEALGGVPCGNYGTCVCDVARDAARGPAVVEVSSFQLETTELPPDAFEAAALLNLQEDHIDRHGSVEAYHALKRRLLTMTRHPVDGTARVVRAEACAEGAALTLEQAASFAKGSYFDNPVLRVNAWCACELLRAAGCDEPTIARAFRTFTPLAHRMQTVCAARGVRWIDDSKATSMAALGAGVEMAFARIEKGKKGEKTGGVRLIAGGQAKGDDPRDEIFCLKSRVEKVYLIGDCAERLYDAWSSAVPCERCGTMSMAVAAARRDACEGDIVLLSPGTASFDQFENYGERGDAFARMAREG